MKRQIQHRIGGAIFPWYSLRIDQLNCNTALQQWLKANPMPVFMDRPALHRHIHDMAPDQPVDYPEFGVLEGERIPMWSHMNAHPKSRFIGFESFEDLPEDWDTAPKAGLFDLGEKLPNIRYGRVSFQKSWFNDTLEPFLRTFEPQSRLIIHNDRDLYSSSLFLLTRLDPFAVPGTMIIFYELYSALQEFHAMKDYMSAYRRYLRPLGRVDDVHGYVAFVFE